MSQKLVQNFWKIGSVQAVYITLHWPSLFF